ncbi:MAG TPA: ABC transporter substrate-binding protein [Acetobacteraceae bacterium]|nr:ABC transporter substrate-binding protein [Acetobacteraceae bacterium]
MRQIGGTGHMLFGRVLLLAATFGAGVPVTAWGQPFQCGHKGGDFTYGLEANVAGLDMQASAAASTRNIAMNIYETLVTRDEHMKPLLQLAQSVDTDPDNKVFTFHLRQGVHFHNGNPMTSADVLASFQRYQRVGIDRSILAPVDHLDAPDPGIFRVTLKEPRPTFLESMSSITVPIIIIPKENVDAPPQQLPAVGTGPFQLVQFVPDSYVKLKRFDGYTPDSRYSDADGFGGYKVACLDTVTFRMVPEPGARVAGLETGELQGVEDVPTIAQKRLATNKSIHLLKLDNFWLNVTYPNWSQAPTDNLKFRQAVQAAVGNEDIMQAATDGAWRPNPSLQYPGTTYYSETGKELLDQHNPEKAKALLKEAGYHGEPVVLLTNKDYPVLYNSALVMSEQLKAVGINAQLQVLDWPSALQRSMKGSEKWNFFFTGWITYVAQGGMQTLRTMAEPNPVFTSPGGKVPAQYMKDFDEVSNGTTVAARQAAFADAQKLAFEDVMVIPFGVMPKVQGVRANVEHYTPFYNPRMYNVWIKQ